MGALAIRMFGGAKRKREMRQIVAAKGNLRCFVGQKYALAWPEIRWALWREQMRRRSRKFAETALAFGGERKHVAAIKDATKHLSTPKRLESAHQSRTPKDAETANIRVDAKGQAGRSPPFIKK